MTRFVETRRGGLINLRHVEQVVREVRWEQEDGKLRKDEVFFAVLASGERVALGEPLDELAAGHDVIVPSPMALFMVVLWCDGGGVEMERVPIVAWRVSADGYPIPLAVGQPWHESWTEAHGTLQLVELPGGGYTEVAFEGVYFATLDSARAYIAERHGKPAAA
jgi:hypothetical protein